LGDCRIDTYRLTFVRDHGFEKPLDVVALRDHFYKDKVAFPLALVLVVVDESGCSGAHASLSVSDVKLLIDLGGLGP
jgi:hypothetical protein